MRRRFSSQSRSFAAPMLLLPPCCQEGGRKLSFLLELPTMHTHMRVNILLPVGTCSYSSLLLRARSPHHAGCSARAATSPTVSSAGAHVDASSSRGSSSAARLSRSIAIARFVPGTIATIFPAFAPLDATHTASPATANGAASSDRHASPSTPSGLSTAAAVAAAAVAASPIAIGTQRFLTTPRWNVCAGRRRRRRCGG